MGTLTGKDPIYLWKKYSKLFPSHVSTPPPRKEKKSIQISYRGFKYGV